MNRLKKHFGKFFVSVHLEFKIFVELEKQIILGKHSKHFKNIKTSFKNDPVDKGSTHNIFCFVSKYLKQIFQKM